MNDNFISMTLLLIIFHIYLFTRLYMIRRKKLNLRKDDKNRKVDTVSEIIHIIIMYGLQIFLWIGLIQRWQAGNHNYFNLILLIVLTIAFTIRCFKRKNILFGSSK